MGLKWKPLLKFWHEYITRMVISHRQLTCKQLKLQALCA